MTREEKTKVKIQEAFYRRIGGRTARSFKLLFDVLPDVAFFMKDKKGRIIALNGTNTANCGFKTELEAIGKTSYDYMPETLAEAFANDDVQVVSSGKPILNAVRPSPDMTDRLIFFTKAPVYDKNGRVIGDIGAYRYINKGDGSPNWYLRFQEIARYINLHFAEHIHLGTLVKLAGCSQSQFCRLFARFFKMTPNAFILTTRINVARDKLENTDKLISDIAAECGFCDQSHFIRTFRRLRHETPRHYRQTHRDSTTP